MRILRVEYVREDDRGILIQIHTGVWQQLNYLKISKSGFLGGHYHKRKTELFYLVKGRAEILIEFPKSYTFTNAAKIMMGDGDMLLIEPFEKHTIYPIEDCEFVELLSLPYSKQDTFIEWDAK